MFGFEYIEYRIDFIFIMTSDTGIRTFVWIFAGLSCRFYIRAAAVFFVIRRSGYPADGEAKYK